MLWVGVTSSVIFLYLAFRGRDWGQMAQLMWQANPMWLLASLTALFASYFFRALRWWTIIRAAGHSVPYWSVFRLLLIGLAGNALLPARGGEVLRVVLLRRRAGVARSFAVGTIFIERLSDIMVMCLMIAASALLLPLPTWVREAQATGVILFLGALSGVLVFGILGERIVGRATALFSWIFGHRWGERIGEMISQTFRSLRQSLSIVGFTLLGTFCVTTSLWCVFEAFMLNVSPLGTVFVGSTQQLASIIPTSSGLVGPYEYFSMKSLELMGKPATVSLACITLYHFVFLVMEIALGALAFIQDESDLRRFWKTAKLPIED